MSAHIENSNKSCNATIPPLGTMLLDGDLILPQDLEFALEHQKYTRQPLGEILVRIGALERHDLDVVLSLQSGLRSL